MADYNILLIRDSPRDEVTRVRSINFMTEAELLLGFGLNLALFASLTNVDSGPRFAKVSRDLNYKGVDSPKLARI